MSRIWTSFLAWVKDMRQAWSRHIVIVSVVAVAFGMLQKPLLSLLSFIESTCLAHLSPDWFGGLVLLLACYLLKREWNYRKIYVPRPVSLWLILLLGIYLYYRHWEGSFSFWPIPYFGKVAWSDLLLLPWGGAVAVALRSRSKEDRFFLSLVLLILCVVLYFIPQAQGNSSFVWPLLSLSMAVGSCLLGYLILHRWGNRQKDKRKEEAQKVMELSSRVIDPDNAIVSEGDDWLGFSSMARGLYKDLKVVDLSTSSLTVGVIASWGKGKSSFINLLMRQVIEDKGIIITFNPRGSKSVSSIQEDFFSAFSRELSRHYWGFSLLLARYTKHIGLLNQYEWTRPLASLLTLFLPGKEREVISRTLRELAQRVYVLLDDLDRLSAEEILEVLKLIDRNASFSNTVFITAYDKSYINNVLKGCLDHGLNHSFIDKYITLEFPLPEPNKEILKRLMGVFLSQRVETGNVASFGDFQRGWRKVAGAVVESLDSVRDLKRYLNLMISRYNEGVRWVDFADYFLLYLLCYKDQGVYEALQSKRLVQLEASSENYVLTPNFEEELTRLSQWDGAKGILERLFPRGKGMGAQEESLLSLRREHSFEGYFWSLESRKTLPYSEAVSSIVSSTRMQNPHIYIDDMIEKLGPEQVINAFLYIVKTHREIEENRAETIELMAYVASKIYGQTNRLNPLMGELMELLKRDRYMKYKEFYIAVDIDEYRKLLAPMQSFMIRTQPLWMYRLIDGIAGRNGIGLRECVYSIDEISVILLKCQEAYYNEWDPGTDPPRYIRDFVVNEYMNNYSGYNKQAILRLISLIRKHPDGCMLVVLDYYEEWINPSSYTFAIYSSLLRNLEKQGFTLDEWLALMEDTRTVHILNYLRSAPSEEYSRNIESLPDEEADWESIDYLYRAVLAQEERERQQASSEG